MTNPALGLVLVLISGVILHWQDKWPKAKPLGLHMFWCALLVILFLYGTRTLHLP